MRLRIKNSIGRSPLDEGCWQQGNRVEVYLWEDRHTKGSLADSKDKEQTGFELSPQQSWFYLNNRGKSFYFKEKNNAFVGKGYVTNGMFKVNLKMNKVKSYVYLLCFINV